MLPNKHACSQCPCTFTTKGSLHRHERNHVQSNSFECSVCKVSFRRKDLLTRHAGIHANSSHFNAERQRTRTACSPCRQARSKCSGDDPCIRCEQKDLSCVFTAESARTSFVPHSRTYDVSSTHIEDILSCTAVEDSSETMDNQLGDDADLAASLQSESQLLELNRVTADEQVTPTSLAWPWLHENLFLSEDMNIDWFELGQTSTIMPITQIDEMQASTPTSSSNQAEMPETAPDAADSMAHEAIIHEFVTAASVDILPSPGLQERSNQFYSKLPSMTRTLRLVFELQELQIESTGLEPYLDLYLKNFWPLWPLSPRQHFIDHVFAPILYLVMVSIGAMYGNRNSSSFGIALHHRLRDILIQPALELDLPEGLMLPLGQARSLTQAASLYFGHQRAFSYAAHLGGALIVQARKMNLFTTAHNMNKEFGDTTHWVKAWINRESKIRLSLAILRLEMYTSALFTTRPLVSGHELDVSLPCSRHIWTTAFTNLDGLAVAVHQDRQSNNNHLLYSDLLSILMDTQSDLPHLDVLHGELLVNALQEEIWEASSSRTRLLRLMPSTTIVMDSGLGEKMKAMVKKVSSRCDTGLDAHLSLCVESKTVLDQIDKITTALRRLRQHILRGYRTYGTLLDIADRSSLLSCLLAYHLGFLQFHAPVAVIQSACHNKAKNDLKENPQLKSWAITTEAKTAAEHAGCIFHLLHAETRKAAHERARVNFLTMLGLYHSATVLYAFTTHIRSPPEYQYPSTDDFVETFGELNPAWAARSSFSNMLQTLR